jgi:hypothetical protein
MQIKTPTYANAAHTLVNCQIDHPTYGWIPFTASAEDPEQHGRDIFAELIAGDHGPIADYVPPPPPSTEVLAQQARAQRDAALSASDWTQLPDAQASLSAEKKAAWADYRQALRDVTEQPGFPGQIDWPTAP